MLFRSFAVMLGLTVGGSPVLGVVYRPAAGTLYFAVAGQGAFVRRDGPACQLSVSRTVTPAEAVLTLSRSRRSPLVGRFQDRLGFRDSVVCGSLGLKAALICEGAADVYVQDGVVNLWDTCAPEALLHEAGGALTDLQGEPLHYGRSPLRVSGVAATNRVLHQRVIDAVAACRE